MKDKFRKWGRWLVLTAIVLLPTAVIFSTTGASASGLSSNKELSPHDSESRQYFDLLIIAPVEFVPALEPLRDHKEAHDMPARIITLEDIYERFSGIDTPEQIKRAIAHYVSNNRVQYVMLVGDVNKFPVRWQLGQFVDDPLNVDYIYASADYYYADLFDSSGTFNSWDYDGDGYYGEIYRNNLNSDKIDPHPDVAVGRVPATDIFQVKTYVAKVIRYEYSPWQSDRNLLLVNQEYHKSVPSMDLVASFLADDGFSATRLYNAVPTGYTGPIDGLPTANNIVNNINRGSDLVSHLTHGQVDSWQLLAMPGRPTPEPDLTLFDVRNRLSNEERLPVIFTAACKTARFYGKHRLPYQSYAPADTSECLPDMVCGGLEKGTVGTVEQPVPAPIQTIDNDTTIAEAFLVERDHGAIAYYGSIHSGQPNYPKRRHSYLGEAFFEAYDVGNVVLGDMWRYALEQWASQHSLETLTDNGKWGRAMIMHTPSRFHLLGDPSLRIGGIAGLLDDVPPETSVHGTAWLRAAVSLLAVDGGSPPSGVRYTEYRLNGGDSWERGSSFNLPDGTHTIEFYSKDFAGNQEIARSAEVHIDSTPPITEPFLNGESAAMQFCPYGAECPPEPCYDSPVTVELEATDNESGVAGTEYRLDGWWESYAGPIEITTIDLIEFFTLRYRSADQAGNAETAQEVEFCVSNDRGGIWRDEASILEGLEGIFAMTMRPAFADKLPPIASVRFEYAAVGQAKYATIGHDVDGKDGWSMPFDSRKVPNGLYNVRMMVFGPSQTKAEGKTQLIYQETMMADISNVPASDYTFSLKGPVSIDGGDSFQFDIKFHNRSDSPMNNLFLTLDLDQGFFDQITILNGGFEDQQKRPAWYRDQLQPGETWKARVTGQVHDNVTPGSAIRAQAAFKSDTIPLLISDNPRTATGKDQTVAEVRFLDDTIAGHVLVDPDSSPIAATVTLAGESSSTTTTDEDGAFHFTELAPGTYSVDVAADHYTYLAPAGPVSVTLQGIGETTAVDFHLRPADERPPEVTLSSSLDAIVEQGNPSASIEGTAIDIEPGTGVQSVEVRIFDAEDSRFWDGNSWSSAGKWLTAIGTTAWTYDVGAVGWQSGHQYVVSVRATDRAGNVSVPVVYSTTPLAPLLVAPADNSNIANQRPTFEWIKLPEAEYILQIDDNEDFSSPIIHLSEYLVTSNYKPSIKLPVGAYFWRVLAVNSAGASSSWSEVWQTTIGLSTKPKLFLPLTIR